MRIAHVTLDGGAPRYGIGLAVLRLARAQRRRGDDVRLLVRAENAAAVRTALDVPVAPLERRGGLLGGRRAYVRQVRRALEGGADVVHAHSVVRMGAWLLPRRARRGAPLVVTAHAADELGATASPSGDATPARARRHARQARAVIGGADAIVAPSEFAARLVAGVARSRRAVVIPHGPTDEAPLARAPHEGFVVLALARLVRVKGLHVLLEAFARVAASRPDARLVLAGEGVERDALLRRADELGLASRVALPGYVEGAERAALLAVADVVAVPTLGDYETFGLAALDGRSAGAYVLVADGGALPERVADGGGRVVRSGDVAAWAGALAEVSTAKAPAAARAAPIGGWDEAARAHEALYASL